MDTSFEERVAQVMQTHEEMIQKFGISNCCVFSTDEKNPSPTFTYTMGLTDVGFPELIMVGVSGPVGSAILNHVFATYLFAGLKPERGDAIHQVIQEQPLRLGTVDPYFCENEYLTSASRRQEMRKGPKITALQLVFPDKNGCFPLEDGYGGPTLLAQTCLGPNETWDYLPEAKQVTGTVRSLQDLEQHFSKRRLN